jgi:hypothetical protein
MIELDVVVLTCRDPPKIFDRTVNSIRQAVETAKDYFKLSEFIIIGEEVKGRGRAREVGWKSGRSNFILFVDTGIILSSNWLIDIHKAITTVGGDVWYGDDSKAGNSDNLIAKCSEIEYSEYADRLIKQGPYVVMHALNTSNCLFRRSILEKVDGFDVNLPFCEDSEIGYRIWKSHGKIVFVYHAKCTNMHRSRFRDKIKQSWEFGLGSAYIKRKHPKFPIRWRMYILLPYSVIKRIFTWGLKYGWVGSIASIIYFFKRTTTLFGYLYSS